MERDGTSKNDYVHARFQSSELGRFLSPDVLGGKPEDPQTWNRYAYARNNPIKFVDANGLEFGYPGQQQDLNQVLSSQAYARGSEICLECNAGHNPQVIDDIPLETPTFAPEDFVAGAFAGVIKGFATRGTIEAIAGVSATASRESVLTGWRFGKHGIDQAISRGISPREVLQGLRATPLKMLTRVDRKGRGSMQIVTEKVTLVINERGEIINIWRTHRKTAAKLIKRLEEELSRLSADR
jgi:RHS repeat-associated protein